MNIKSTAKFALGAALLSPLLATEDVLRHFDVKISPHGLFRNDEGKSVLEIWEESAPAKPISAKDLDIGGPGMEVLDGPMATWSNQGFVIPEGA